MSASALLLHRILIKAENRGWKSLDDPRRELTQTAMRAVAPTREISVQSQIVNCALPNKPDSSESPPYSPTEHQKDRHG